MARIASEALVLAHVFAVIVWLGFDLIVFSLSMSLLNRELSIDVRVERATLAERIDWWVLVAFMGTFPLGLAISMMRGSSLFGTSWLSLKLVFYGIIVLIAMVILTGAGSTSAILRRIAEVGSGDEREALEAQLRRRVLWLAPPVLLIFFCILANLYIALNPYRF